MKALYVLSIDMGSEMSEYFLSMTPKQAKELRGMLEGYSIGHKLTKITESPGYNSYKDIVHMIKDMGNG
jgi:hypothetical protein